MHSKHKITIPFDPIGINFDLDGLKTPVSEIIGVNESKFIRAYLVPTNVVVRSKRAYMTVNLHANKIYEIIDITGKIKYVRVGKRGGLKKVSKKEVKNEMERSKVQRVIELLADNSGIED
jgi:hypothetical protein